MCTTHPKASERQKIEDTYPVFWIAAVAAPFNLLFLTTCLSGGEVCDPLQEQTASKRTCKNSSVMGNTHGICRLQNSGGAVCNSSAEEKFCQVTIVSIGTASEQEMYWSYIFLDHNHNGPPLNQLLFSIALLH